jgi:hypothetical protein
MDVFRAWTSTTSKYVNTRDLAGGGRHVTLPFQFFVLSCAARVTYFATLMISP